MVEVQIAGRGIRDQRVLRAMRGVPREVFVDAGLEQFAYEDGPLPIAERQTISQPYVVALMTEAAEIDENDRLLEVGAGSGYAAAVAGSNRQTGLRDRAARIAGRSGPRTFPKAGLPEHRTETG